MQTQPQSSAPGKLRAWLQAGWLGFLLMSALFALLIYAWMEPASTMAASPSKAVFLYFVEYLPLASLSLAVNLWWYFVPLLVLTIWDFQRSFRSSRKKISDYDL